MILGTFLNGCAGSDSDPAPFPSPPPALVAPAVLNGRIDLPFRITGEYGSLREDSLLHYVASQHNGLYKDEESFRDALRAGLDRNLSDDEQGTSLEDGIAAQVNWGKEYLIFTTHYSPVTCNSSRVERVLYTTDEGMVTLEYSEQQWNDGMGSLDAATGETLPPSCRYAFACGYLPSVLVVPTVIPAVPVQSNTTALVPTSLDWWTSVCQESK